MTLGKCGVCRFWEYNNRSDAIAHSGKCLRYPPAMYVVDNGQRESFTSRPHTTKDDMCGEFERTEKQ